VVTITRFVNSTSENTPGGDGTTNNTSGATRAYASWSEWELNEQTDLVTDTNSHVVELSGADADTSVVVIAGWVTGASNTITVNGDNRSGRWSSSAYRLVVPTSAATQAGRSLNDYVTLNDVQVERVDSGTTTNVACWRHDTGVVGQDYNRCIFRASGSGTGALGWGLRSGTSSGTTNIRNCLFYDLDTGLTRNIGVELAAGASGTVNVDNCTAYNCETGVRHISGTTAIQNILVQNCTTTYSGAIGSADYCASDLGDAPGTNAVDTVVTMTFADAGNGDFRPKAGEAADDAVIAAGLDLSGTFSDDLRSAQRQAGAFTIGALAELRGSGAFMQGLATDLTVGLVQDLVQ